MKDADKVMIVKTLTLKVGRTCKQVGDTDEVLFALGLGKTKLARLSFFETFEISLVLKKTRQKIVASQIYDIFDC